MLSLNQRVVLKEYSWEYGAKLINGNFNAWLIFDKNWEISFVSTKEKPKKLEVLEGLLHNLQKNMEKETQKGLFIQLIKESDLCDFDIAILIAQEMKNLDDGMYALVKLLEEFIEEEKNKKVIEVKNKHYITAINQIFDKNSIEKIKKIEILDTFEGNIKIAVNFTLYGVEQNELYNYDIYNDTLELTKAHYEED